LSELDIIVILYLEIRIIKNALIEETGNDQATLASIMLTAACRLLLLIHSAISGLL